MSYGFTQSEVDALFLDLPNPEDYIPQVRHALKSGGFFGCLLPTTNQVSRLLEALQAQNFSFIEVCEIIQRNYKPVPRGEFGDKVLLTNLFNFVQPIVRYEIGDMTGYAKQRCKCGLPFATMLPVPNRIKDIFYFRNPQGGYVSVAPHIFMAALHRAYAIYHYRLTQTQRNELTLHYVSDEDPEELARREAVEEAGVEVGAIVPVTSYYPSAGGCNERLDVFVGQVDTSSAGGVHGLECENEDIRVQVVSREEAYKLVKSGIIENGASIIALQWLELNHIDLKSRWLKSHFWKAAG